MTTAGMTAAAMTAAAATGTNQDVPVDPHDVRFAQAATGLLRTFNQAGVVSAADVHVARRLGRLGDEPDERVQLAVALAVRAVRLGSVCVVLAQARATVSSDDESRVGVTDLPWPDPDGWVAACAASPLVAVGSATDAPGGPGRPLRLVHDLLYLDRYWREEEQVRLELDSRASRAVGDVDEERLHAALAALFTSPEPDRQRLAAAMTALRSVSVLAGGPGTGKTTTVARLIALLRELHGPGVRVALAAPTGKAAARLQEAIDLAGVKEGLGVADVQASTLHRLLGRRPDSQSRFRHNRDNRLSYDVVVVDETSMVSLSMMARLLEAVRPEARLVLVGDPDQLASVEAGAVLGDLVERPAPASAQVPAGLVNVVGDDLEAGETVTDALRNGIVRLRHPYRFSGAIEELATAVRTGQPEQVEAVLRRGDPSVELVETDAGAWRPGPALDSLRADVVSAAAALVDTARAGDVDTALRMLGRHRLLCAHRRGPYGVARWTDEIEGWLATDLAGYRSREQAEGEWYVGRPLLVTANDYDVRLYNGDTGVVVRHPDRGIVAAFGRAGKALLLSPNRLSAVQTVHATTVHRAQGSQFERVSLLLPPADSPLLTRELFYTAVTRAEQRVRVLGSVDAVRLAVSRPIVRASGLRRHPGP